MAKTTTATTTTEEETNSLQKYKNTYSKKTDVQ